MTAGPHNYIVMTWFVALEKKRLFLELSLQILLYFCCIVFAQNDLFAALTSS